MRSHTAHIAAIDLFVIPTIGFNILYGPVILRLERRRLDWTNVTRHPTAESIRRECLDHVVALGERHLRELLANYSTYYNEVHTHVGLSKDARLHWPARTVGRIASVSWLGGLHHQCVRMA